MFNRFTIASGKTAAGDVKAIICGNGHWKPISAAKAARRRGVVGDVSVRHCVGDMSGRGRGGHDGTFTVSATDEVTQTSKWREGSREVLV